MFRGGLLCSLARVNLMSRDPYTLFKCASFVKSKSLKFFWIFPPLLFFGFYVSNRRKSLQPQIQQKNVSFYNWSCTKEVNTEVLFEPTSLKELVEVVKQANLNKTKFRPVGAGLSPSGLGFCKEGMITLAKLESKICVDTFNKRVNVTANVTVGELAEELRKYNLTLENFASINDQSVGGFIQAGCHGTGALVPPVNDQVEGLVLVTPGLGPIRILPGTHTFKDTQNEVDIKIIADDELFSLVKCGLGGLGIVYEVTLRCVPLENLEEVTKVFRLEELKKIHTRLLLENRHVRYMWYPFTDSVVVVTSNPTSKTAAPVALSHSHSLKPLREIMTHRTGGPSERPGDPTSLAAFRDALISLDPLNVDFIRQVNKAEVQCWKNLEGTRIGTSPEILSFDCGGQQCVYEVAFKVEQNCAHNESPDIEFVMRLLKRIETLNIPAPAPIEQRWSQSSSSMMSPAYSTSISDIFTWIGIIMYLPVGSDLHTLNARWNIKEVFHKVYTKVLLEAGPVDPLQLRAHWAKLDLPAPEGNELSELRAKLRKQYPLKLYNTYRRLLDPNSILTNQWMDLLIAQND